MAKSQLSRRHFLKALGVGPALLPMLESEFAQAQACAGVSGPKRAFFLVWANGMLSKSSSWPGTGTGYTLPSFMSSLEPHRADMLLLDGLAYDFVRSGSLDGSSGEVSGHSCFQGMLTGRRFQSFGSSTAQHVASGISIDQYIGGELRKQGYTGLTALTTMVYSRSTARLSWRGANDPIVPDYDPFHVFDQLFAGQPTAPTNPTPTDPSEPEPITQEQKILMMRKSVLDNVMADLNRFSAKVGTDDRMRIESHLQSVREIEERLAQQIGMTMPGDGGGGGGGTVTPPDPGSACAAPDLGSKVDVRSTTYFEAVTKMQIDLSVAALASDATRVVVLQIGDQGDPDIILGTLGFTSGGQDGNTGNINGYHSIAHRNGSEKVICDTWFQSQVAYAIASLANVGDGAARLLDNTILVAMNNMRTGNHEYNSVPAVLAGMKSFFKQGDSLNVNGMQVNAIHTAVSTALGVPIQSFGDSQFSSDFSRLSV